MQKIETSPFDEKLNQWGVSLLRLQASVPKTLPGQGVIFVLYGDIAMQNAVADQEAFVPAEEPITVTARSAANIRSGASSKNNVLMSVPSGTVLPADAISPDKAWLRVVSDGQPGWVSTSVVKAAGDLKTLPILTRESRMPMQSFYLTTNIAGVSCNEAPALLVIQGPEKATVDLTANGVGIRLGSTVVIRMIDAHTMEIITISGTVHVGNFTLPRGFSVSVPLSADGHSQDGTLINLHPLDESGLKELISLESIPAKVLNYPIKLPTLEEIQQAMAAAGGSGSTRAVATGPAAGRAQCSTMRLTSPLDAWARQSTAFYWDAARGATSYRLVIQGVGSTETTATTAKYGLDAAPDVNSIAWKVEALVNGQVACVAGPITIPRDQFAGNGGSGGCHYDINTNSMVCS